MTQPDDLRELLKNLALWANRARFKLDPLGGTPPTGGATCRIDSMLVKDVDKNPFGQLYLLACKILGFPQAYWPAGLPEAAKEVTELRTLLRPIEKHYGENQTTKGLKRIAGLVESILSGGQLEAKEAQGAVDSTGKIPNKGVGKKRSTTGGDARVKLITALSFHHKYELNGICFSCLNHDPIGNNELADLAEVDKSTASLFFKKSFGDKGYSQYRQDCIAGRLPFALKMLRGEAYPAEYRELVKNAHKAGLEQGEAE